MHYFSKRSNAHIKIQGWAFSRRTREIVKAMLRPLPLYAAIKKAGAVVMKAIGLI